MRILAFKPGHDGHIACITDGTLELVVEAEKDSGFRYAPVDGTLFAEFLQLIDTSPDVFALSGWARGANPNGRPIGAGYFGVNAVQQRRESMFGVPLQHFSSSHERSHVLCAYALSPFPQGTACYALTWEGYIGSFYEVDANVKVRKVADIMLGPGVRYAAVYAIADPTFALPPGGIRLGDAGKLMALAAYERNVIATHQEHALLAKLLSSPLNAPNFCKDEFCEFELFNSGVESTASKRIARLISDAIFAYFKDQVSSMVIERRPLLVSGGCGLNCEWNRQWLDSGLFSEVFVPPCTNDTGAAIGTAADAQLHVSGNAKLRWDVYCGVPFADDIGVDQHARLGSFVKVSNDLRVAARLLRSGAILGWVSGRSELGPRALGNRSILAEPFHQTTRVRLNDIKQREQYRPIAPLCLEEDVSLHFDLNRSSPHMLFFAASKTDTLQAVTHVDGSARVQTLNEKQHPLLHRLLRAFKVETGVGVLCNTSLNFNGRGFINRTSDLIRYADEHKLDGFIIDGVIFLREGSTFAQLP
jgi:hydroxymethyl cephem carbamoyltransferase